MSARRVPEIVWVNRQGRHRLPVRRLRAQLERLARLEPLALPEICFVFVTPAESARLHREHLGVGGMTDVITYRHGDIVVCPAVAWREASRRGLTFRNELLRYCVHGWLHLRGHDDHEEAARVRMHRRQEELVGQLEAGAQKD